MKALSLSREYNWNFRGNFRQFKRPKKYKKNIAVFFFSTGLKGFICHVHSYKIDLLFINSFMIPYIC